MKKSVRDPGIIFADDFSGFGAESHWHVVAGKGQARWGGKCQGPRAKCQRTAALGKGLARIKRRVHWLGRVHGLHPWLRTCAPHGADEFPSFIDFPACFFGCPTVQVQDIGNALGSGHR